MSRSSQMLASVYTAVTDQGQSPIADLIGIAAPTTVAPQPDAQPVPLQKGRTRIWDLHTNLHCSIIGTCLSAAELRRLLLRLKVVGAEAATDHDLHMLGVRVAANTKDGAKLLQKALDRRHHLAIVRFAKARDAAALVALWEEAMTGGDVPGAYWALLTHPLTTDSIVKRVFGDVHMLSHLVGATNRADIRRLRQLEQDNAALVERLDRQQKQLRADIAERDGAIHRLTEQLSQKLLDEKALVARASDAGNFLEVIRELEKRLDEELPRRDVLERNLALVSEAYEHSERARIDSEQERDALRDELVSVEAQLHAVLQPTDDAGAQPLDLSGLTVLYVGGRAKQVRQLKSLVERLKGELLHHDAGVEHSPRLLPGLISRADVAVFPVDCVSHDAVASIKRLCHQIGRPYLPLRTSSLTCLLSALTALRARLSPQTLQ